MLRLLRLCKIGQYTHKFDRYSTIIGQAMPVLKLTLMIALVVWVFFAVLMYYAERGA